MTPRKVVLWSLIGAAIVMVAQQSMTDAPAGFTTPALGLTVGPNGELVGNAGAQSVRNGIAEPPGNTFALDQAQFERRHDPSTGLGPVFNAMSCAECHQNGVTRAASQLTEAGSAFLDKSTKPLHVDLRSAQIRTRTEYHCRELEYFSSTRSIGIVKQGSQNGGSSWSLIAPCQGESIQA